MRNKTPLVSIITITYNQDRYIRQCLDSAQKQTYPNWEQVIIDDESKDKTPDIIAEYHDPRIHYVKQKNVGIWRTGESWNKALGLSQGELIAHLDGDDCWPIDKLERQVNDFQNPNVVMSWGKCGWIDSEGKSIRVTPPDTRWFLQADTTQIISKLLVYNFISAVTVICRKSALISIGGFKQPSYLPYHDYATWLDLGSIGKIRFSDQILGHWRHHKSQVTSTMDLAMAERGRYALEYFDHNPEIMTIAGIKRRDIRLGYMHEKAEAYLKTGNLIKALEMGNRQIKIQALKLLFSKKHQTNLFH